MASSSIKWPYDNSGSGLPENQITLEASAFQGNQQVSVTCNNTFSWKDRSKVIRFQSSSDASVYANLTVNQTGIKATKAQSTITKTPDFTGAVTVTFNVPYQTSAEYMQVALQTSSGGSVSWASVSGLTLSGGGTSSAKITCNVTISSKNTGSASRSCQCVLTNRVDSNSTLTTTVTQSGDSVSTHEFLGIRLTPSATYTVAYAPGSSSSFIDWRSAPTITQGSFRIKVITNQLPQVQVKYTYASGETQTVWEAWDDATGLSGFSDAFSNVCVGVFLCNNSTGALIRGVSQNGAAMLNKINTSWLNSNGIDWLIPAESAKYVPAQATAVYMNIYPVPPSGSLSGWDVGTKLTTNAAQLVANLETKVVWVSSAPIATSCPYKYTNGDGFVYPPAYRVATPSSGSFTYDDFRRQRYRAAGYYYFVCNSLNVRITWTSGSSAVATLSPSNFNSNQASGTNYKFEVDSKSSTVVFAFQLISRKSDSSSDASVTTVTNNIYYKNSEGASVGIYASGGTSLYSFSVQRANLNINDFMPNPVPSGSLIQGWPNGVIAFKTPSSWSISWGKPTRWSYSNASSGSYVSSSYFPTPELDSGTHSYTYNWNIGPSGNSSNYSGLRDDMRELFLPVLRASGSSTLTPTPAVSPAYKQVLDDNDKNLLTFQIYKWNVNDKASTVFATFTMTRA